METYRPRIVLVGPNDLNRRILGSFFEGKAEVIVENARPISTIRQAQGLINLLSLRETFPKPDALILYSLDNLPLEQTPNGTKTIVEYIEAVLPKAKCLVVADILDETNLNLAVSTFLLALYSQTTTL